jgi:hypothetical protein
MEAAAARIWPTAAANIRPITLKCCVDPDSHSRPQTRPNGKEGVVGSSSANDRIECTIVMAFTTVACRLLSAQLLTLRPRAMADLQHVNVLLPRHYDSSGPIRYPVLYLLHGAFGN